MRLGIVGGGHRSRKCDGVGRLNIRPNSHLLGDGSGGIGDSRVAVGILFTADRGTQPLEFRLQRLITAVQVVNVRHVRLPVGDESGEDETRAGPEILRLHVGAAQAVDADDGRGVSLDDDVRTQTPEFGHVREPIVIDRVGDEARSVGDGKRGDHLRLEIGRKAGMDVRGDVRARQPTASTHVNGLAVDPEIGARRTELADCGGEMFRDDVRDLDLTPRHRPRDHVRPRLDSIGDVPEGDGMQLRLAVHGHRARARSFDRDAHRLEALRERDHLRFRGGVGDLGDALRERGRHHDVRRRAHTGDIEMDTSAAQPIRLGDDVPVVHLHLRTERPEPLEVKIDGARSPGAAAGQGNARFSESGEKRPQDVEGGAHLAHDLVGRLMARERRRVDGKRPRSFLYGRPEVLQKAYHGPDVSEVRHRGKATLPRSEEKGGKDRQDGILRAGDLDAAGERPSALDDELFHRRVHVLLGGIHGFRDGDGLGAHVAWDSGPGALTQLFFARAVPSRRDRSGFGESFASRTPPRGG